MMTPWKKRKLIRQLDESFGKAPGGRIRENGKMELNPG